jgi:hypothetical protein
MSNFGTQWIRVGVEIDEPLNLRRETMALPIQGRGVMLQVREVLGDDEGCVSVSASPVHELRDVVIIQYGRPRSSGLVTPDGAPASAAELDIEHCEILSLSTIKKRLPKGEETATAGSVITFTLEAAPALDP